MNQRKILFVILIVFVVTIFAGAIDFVKIDQLSHDGKYQEALDILKSNFKTDPAIIWRISREWYFIGDNVSDKDERKAIFTKGMGILKPFVKIEKTGKKEYKVTTKLEGDKRDIANLSYWYAVNYGSWGKAKGIKDSLGIIPILFALSNNAISTDPTFAGPYTVLAKIDDAVPGFLGGDKFRMGVNFAKSIKSDPKDIETLVFASLAFYKRNWSIDKKKEVGDDGTPRNLSDREYSKKLTQDAIKYYNEIKNPATTQTEKYNIAKNLLKKFK